MTFRVCDLPEETFAESQARWAQRYWERRHEEARAAPCAACGKRGDEHRVSWFSPRFTVLYNDTLVLLPAPGEGVEHERLYDE